MKTKSAVGKVKWKYGGHDPDGKSIQLVLRDEWGKNIEEKELPISLIASAPELLEACEAMMEAWENNAGLRDVISFNTAFQKAHKAIAKAEGRA